MPHPIFEVQICLWPVSTWQFSAGKSRPLSALLTGLSFETRADAIRHDKSLLFKLVVVQTFLYSHKEHDLAVEQRWADALQIEDWSDLTPQQVIPKTTALV